MPPMDHAEAHAVAQKIFDDNALLYQNEDGLCVVGLARIFPGASHIHEIGTGETWEIALGNAEMWALQNTMEHPKVRDLGDADVGEDD